MYSAKKKKIKPTEKSMHYTKNPIGNEKYIPSTAITPNIIMKLPPFNYFLLHKPTTAPPLKHTNKNQKK